MNILSALIGDDHTNCPGRIDEAHRVHEAMLEDWRARGVHFIGCSGDWNEVPPSEADQQWSRDYLARAADMAPVVIIPGNHDPEGSLNEFHLQNEFKHPITVVTRPDVVVVDTAAGKLAVACVPFVWKAHLLAQAGTVPVEEADQMAEKLLGQIFLGLGIKVRELGLPTVALIHGKWRGSKLNAEQPNRPLGMEIAVEDIGQIGAHVTNIGHIHLAQATEWNGFPILTPSSCFYVDYGESKHFKGYIIASLPAEGPITPDMVQVERIPTPVTPMILLEAFWHEVENGVSGFLDVNDEPFGYLEGTKSRIRPDVSGADVRFRFHYPKESEKQAKAVAENFGAHLRETYGAVNVTLDPVPQPAIRSRIPELTAATTLEEKAGLYRQSTEAVVTGDEQKILDGMVHEIQDELALEGVSFGIQSRAVPTLKRIRGKGWLGFADEFDINFERLGALTAVVAPNEGGKTTFMSLAGPGLLYGNTPNRGTLDDLSRARDAFIEGTFDMDGKEYTLGQVSNAMVKSNKGHVNLHSAGKPVLQKAGRAEYKEWADKNLLPWNQYLSLLFHSGSEDDGGRKISIIDMKDASRTELMLKVLGIEFYESIAKKARDRAAAATTSLEKTQARLSELRGGQAIEYWTERIASLTHATETSVAEVTAGEKTLSELRDRNSAIDKEWSDYNARVEHRKELETKLTKLEEDLREVNARIANNQEVVDQAEAIRAAHVEVDSLQQQLDNLQEIDRDLKIRAAKVEHILEIAGREHRAQEARRNETIKAIASLNGLAATKAGVQATIDSIPEFETAVREATKDRDGAFKEYEELQSANVVGLAGRVSNFRNDMRFIAEGTDGGDPAAFAGGSLESDDKLAKDDEEQPTKLRQAKAAWQQREQRATELAGQLARIEREAEKMPEILQAGNRAAELEEIVRATEKEIEAIAVNIEKQTAERDRIAAAITENDGKAKGVSVEIDKLKLLAGRLNVLNSTEARLEELSKQQAGIAADIELNKEMAHELSFLERPPTPVELREHEQALASLREAAQGVRSRLVMAESGLEDEKKRAARRAELNTEAEGLRRQLDRWNRLAREFGTLGLQKEEIANCGESLTSIVNELLRAGGDMDHTVDIRTERPHGREDRMIPCFEILVSDPRVDGGRPKEARRLSAYGQTVVGKALAMAMATLGCERAKIKSCTVWFDELTGVATPDNAIKIIGMLRHFAARLCAQILFVSQDPEIQAMADSRILIDNGKVAVV